MSAIVQSSPSLIPDLPATCNSRSLPFLLTKIISC